MSKLDAFLERLDKAFPSLEAKVVWQMASYQISQERCGVLVGSVCCNMKKIGDLCPYHRDCRRDFLRRCKYMTDGVLCQREITSRDLKVAWCAKHMEPPKPVIRIRRVGDYVVIKDTPFAISDDMRFIIGRVEATYLLTYVLMKEADPFMEEIANLYGLSIRFEE
jgi:hypothetical protein